MNRVRVAVHEPDPITAADAVDISAQPRGTPTRHHPSAAGTSTWDRPGTRARRPVVESLPDDPVDANTWRLEHQPQAAGAARDITAAVLASWHVDQETTETAMLVVSELVTNAIEHAQPPLALHLIHEHRHRQLRLEVTDGGSALREGDWTASCEPDEHGRGLSIVNAVATAHGACVYPGGATHWACLSTAAQSQ
ncbi:ATP-binding protein [Streptomyces sp. NPDC020681]|uniref:ATP-binding protein n=1 Tax=Streptomyces sp. NPDC020681 TaxID=3365083 RepID=UPI00379A6063